MKANEVRLNNYVIYDNKVYQIDTIAEVFPTLNNDKFGIGVVDWNNIKPVPLTEEWLIKFRFVRINNFNRILFKKDGFDFVATKIKDAEGFHFRHMSLGIEVIHVHQLQNLFFAINQKELTL